MLSNSHPTTDPDKKYDEILRQLNSIKADLPQDLYSLETLKIQAGNTNIVQSALVTSNGDYPELRKYAEELKDEISSLPGVMKAEAVAYPEQELKVSIDLPKMSQLHITLNQVIGAIQSENANIPGEASILGPKNSISRQAAAMPVLKMLTGLWSVPVRTR